MTAMSILLGILFVGLTLFAVQYGLRPTEPGGPSIVALAAKGRAKTDRTGFVRPLQTTI